jgi:hypothetical protein
MNISKNQIIGVNDGSDDNPYMATVGAVSKVTSTLIVLRDVEFTGMIVAKLSPKDFHRIVLNPCNDEDWSAIPARIENNMVVAWK